MGNVECVRKRGKVACRGENERGILGRGIGGPASREWSVIRLSGAANEIVLAHGESFACALHGDGKLSCWGLNLASVLGRKLPSFDGSDFARSLSTPVTIPGIKGVQEVDVSVARICVRDKIGDVYCWGQNTYGEVTDPREDPRFEVPEPRKANLPTAARSVYVFSAQTCALLIDNELHCWGGAVPSDNGPIPAYVPVRVAPNVTAVSISKDEVACAATASGEVCWPILDPTVRGQFEDPYVRRVQ